VRRDQYDSLPRPTLHCRTQQLRMLLIFGAQAEVHQVHSIARGPIDGVDQRLYLRRKRLMKNFHREYFGIGRFFADDCRYGSSVAESINVIAIFGSV